MKSRAAQAAHVSSIEQAKTSATRQNLGVGDDSRQSRPFATATLGGPDGSPPDPDCSLDVAPTRLRIGAAAASLGVSVDTLRRWEKEGRIHFERVGNQRVISSDEVERLLRDRPARARTSSARNRLEGTVVAIKRGRVMSQIELACGPFRVVSLLSTDSLDDLGLKPGDRRPPSSRRRR